MDKPAWTEGQCQQTDCDVKSTHRVFWPGREPMELCMKCADRAKGVSMAMGFYLHMEPLGDDGDKP